MVREIIFFSVRRVVKKTEHRLTRNRHKTLVKARAMHKISSLDFDDLIEREKRKTNASLFDWFPFSHLKKKRDDKVEWRRTNSKIDSLNLSVFSLSLIINRWIRSVSFYQVELSFSHRSFDWSRIGKDPFEHSTLKLN